jgi:hypothetical protein
MDLSNRTGERRVDAWYDDLPAFAFAEGVADRVCARASGERLLPRDQPILLVGKAEDPGFCMVELCGVEKAAVLSRRTPVDSAVATLLTAAASITPRGGP